MHLRSLRIRGFKSFPEPVEISLEPGVSVIVGPNGSGKSNIADALVWAAGSLTPSELRAEKPDDVLFAGGADLRTRHPAPSSAPTPARQSVVLPMPASPCTTSAAGRWTEAAANSAIRASSSSRPTISLPTGVVSAGIAPFPDTLGS